MRGRSPGPALSSWRSHADAALRSSSLYRSSVTSTARIWLRWVSTTFSSSPSSSWASSRWSSRIASRTVASSEFETRRLSAGSLIVDWDDRAGLGRTTDGYVAVLSALHTTLPCV
jgi:hypothetical protein